MLGLRTDEDQVVQLDDLGELGILAEEAVAGMDRVRAGDFRRGYDVRDVQIAVGRRRWADADRLVRQPHVHRIGVGGGMDRDGLYPHFAARTVDAQRDFAAVGDQQLLDLRHAAYSTTTSGWSNSTGWPFSTSTAFTTPAFGAATPLILASIDRLGTLNNLGTTRDVYRQNSKSFALFTHNIIKLTDNLSFTAGLRWTQERKRFDATFGNNNTVCPQIQGLLGAGPAGNLFNNAQLAALTRGIATLACTGNSSAALNGRTLADNFKEDQLTGTAVLSWKPVDRVMTYASYSRGYKAGGYNLDRSDLGDAYNPATIGNATGGRLRFDPETVNAYEIGLKYSSRQFTFNIAGFRSEFKNFQLNTFNGTNYVVENIGSCSNDLNGADRDNSAATGACSGNVKYGVLSQGVEVEAGFYPARNLAVNLGYTFADTKYRRNLVGSDAGAPLDPALFLLSGSQMSNAPRNVITSSVAWTPDIGSDGMSALFYVDQRTASDYNTGSDLFVEKMQDGFTVVNARVGLRGRDGQRRGLAGDDVGAVLLLDQLTDRQDADVGQDRLGELHVAVVGPRIGLVAEGADHVDAVVRQDEAAGRVGAAAVGDDGDRAHAGRQDRRHEAALRAHQLLGADRLARQEARAHGRAHGLLEGLGVDLAGHVAVGHGAVRPGLPAQVRGPEHLAHGHVDGGHEHVGRRLRRRLGRRRRWRRWRVAAAHQEGRPGPRREGDTEDGETGWVHRIATRRRRPDCRP